MAKRLLVAAAATVVLVGAGGATAVATSAPELRATGPTSVAGTDGTAVFQIADRKIRQVRYQDRGTLVYTFELVNDGMLDVRVAGSELPAPDPRLFEHLELTDSEGRTEFTVGGGDTVEVSLHLLMTDCETLSARAGSSVTDVTLLTSGSLGMGDHEVTVELPEEVRAGSPREAGCANATATSRPPG